MRTTKAQISLRIRAVWSTPLLFAAYSIISLDSIAEISRLKLASVAAQAALCLAWSETPEDMFSRDEAHMLISAYSDQVFRICDF